MKLKFILLCAAPLTWAADTSARNIQNLIVTGMCYWYVDKDFKSVGGVSGIGAVIPKAPLPLQGPGSRLRFQALLL